MKTTSRSSVPPAPSASTAAGEILPPSVRSPDDDWLVVLAFSGGGTRAAALSYGVLEELARTPVSRKGRTHRLLDEVDTLSAVSGGSFTAAYYALHGDRIFKDFEKDFLKRDMQNALLRQFAKPRNWLRLVSGRAGRSDLADEYYDRVLFESATYGDLTRRPNRPHLILNATDMVTGTTFAFTQRNFDLIGSDLVNFPISRAVAASSAAPLVFSPVTVRNLADHPAVHATACITRLKSGDVASDAPPELVSALRSYLDVSERPYVHLVDGGVADNLGLRGLLDVSALSGGLENMLRHCRVSRIRKVAVIVVNAAAQHGSRWNHGSRPGMLDVLHAVSEHATHRSSSRTLAAFKAELETWRAAGLAGPEPEARDFHVVEVGFEHLADASERQFFHELPTTLSLPGSIVDRLREVGGRLLRESPAFQALRDALERPAAVPASLESDAAPRAPSLALAS